MKSVKLSCRQRKRRHYVATPEVIISLKLLLDNMETNGYNGLSIQRYSNMYEYAKRHTSKIANKELEEIAKRYTEIILKNGVI